MKQSRRDTKSKSQNFNFVLCLDVKTSFDLTNFDLINLLSDIRLSVEQF